MDGLAKDILVKAVIIIIIVVLGYFLVIRPVLTKLGVIESKEDKKRNKESKELGTSTSSPFHPSYYKNKVGVVLITRAKAEELAKTISNAIGFFYDDENAVYGALRQLKNKNQLSFLADVFFQKYQMDLYQLLNRNLGDEEMDVINGIAANLTS